MQQPLYTPIPYTALQLTVLHKRDLTSKKLWILCNPARDVVRAPMVVPRRLLPMLS